jgi:hypothetical protein
MKNLFIPVLLSALVLPGAGQMFNREKIKGAVLMALFVALSVALVVVIVAVVLPILPDTGGAPMSMDEAKAFTTRVWAERGDGISAVWWGLMAVWVYGFLDAFLGARARARATAPKN